MWQIVSRVRLMYARRTRLEIPWQARSQGAVVYCAFEGQAGLRNRVEAFRQRKLAEGAVDVPFYLIADAMNLVAAHAAFIASVRAALGDTDTRRDRHRYAEPLACRFRKRRSRT